MKSFRIPLGIKCRHTYTTKEDGCNYFFGKKFLKHKDGTVWCHLELIGEKNDNFKVDYERDDETILNKNFVPSSISIGSSMDEDSNIGKSFFEKSKSPSNASEKSANSYRMQTRSIAAKKQVNQEVASSPNQAFSPNRFADLVKPFQVANQGHSRVLDGEYIGNATRSKSVKLAKRTAATQDSGATSLA